VIRLGRGLGSLNASTPAGWMIAAALLDAHGLTSGAVRLREEAHGRRLNMVDALVVLVRGSPTSDTERTVLSAALRIVVERRHTQGPAPVLRDVVDVLEEGPETVRLPTLDRGNADIYRSVVDPLQRSLLSLIEGRWGRCSPAPPPNASAWTRPPVCVDVAGISATDTALQPPVLWRAGTKGSARSRPRTSSPTPGSPRSAGSSSSWTSCGGCCAPPTAWSTRSTPAPGCNRQEGVGQAMISHSMADLRALKNVEDRDKARGFVERAGLVVLRGAPGGGAQGPHPDRVVHRRRSAPGHVLVDPRRGGTPPTPRPGAGSSSSRSGNAPGSPVRP
jgi:hypothetical protein